MALKLNIDKLKPLQYDPEERRWDALIEAAMSGNVVPVIGPDILCKNEDGLNVNEIVISLISNSIGLDKHHSSFSQLVYDSDFLAALRKVFGDNNLTEKEVYGLVNSIFSDKDYLKQFFPPSEALKKLLKIKVFPFVITTSFSPIVENVMKEVWGESNVQVLSFTNNPSWDRTPGEGDIGKASDMLKPTVYYMFGKTSNMENRYALLDNDMLVFCKSWLSDNSRPENLCAMLKDKYLLMLGCGYSDWLFRFIWFCMNKTPDVKVKGMMAKDDSTHESLVEYLRRIDAFLPENKSPEEIIDEIYRRVNESDWFSKFPKGDTDVFISYSRSDSAVAEKLYQALTEAGLSVWYDRNNLSGGSKFMDEIEMAIERSKIFVPVFSRNISREAMDDHVYRKEWAKAIDRQESMGSRKYIMPIHKKDFDFYEADIPKGMKAHNSIEFDDNMDFSELVKSVKSALEDLKNFKTTMSNG